MMFFLSTWASMFVWNPVVAELLVAYCLLICLIVDET